MPLVKVPPRLFVSGLPTAEHANAAVIQNLLFNLLNCTDEFDAAVSLFKFSRRMGSKNFGDRASAKRREWMFIAARAAASAVYKFAENVEWIEHNLAKCPTIRAYLDTKKKKEAGALFRQAFPHYRGARHVAHHHGKVYGSPQKLAQHATGNFIITGSLIDDVFQASFEKKVVELPITQASGKALRQVRDLFWGAFEPLDPGYRSMVKLRQNINREIAKAKRTVKGNKRRRTHIRAG